MKPSEKGWFKDYLQQRSEKLLSDYGHTGDMPDREKIIYKWIQPSGLMYGHPVMVPFQDAQKIAEYDDTDRLKLIMAESFLMSMYSTSEDRENLKDQLVRAPGKVIQFYESLFPDISLQPGDLMNSDEAKAEDLISKRLSAPKAQQKNFWSKFFSNSLLFLDVYYFFRYLETHQSINQEELRRQLDQLRMVIVKVISAAAHANKSVEQEEREIFNYFLISARLPPDKKSEARLFFEKGASLDELQFPEMQSWLLKKYVLELATLTLLSDKHFEKVERSFLRKLTKLLALDDEEMNNSILAIESFVLENWKNLKLPGSEENLTSITGSMETTLKNILSQHSDMLASEFKESKKLMEILSRHTTSSLSEEEKMWARQKILGTLSSIPAFVLIALPGTFVTFPMLVKVLPKDVLPNS